MPRNLRPVGMVLAVLVAVAGACRPGEKTGTTREAASAAPADSFPHVELYTNFGNIVLALNAGKAPITVKNFMLLVHAKFYDGLLFHRVRPGFMIQAGSVTKDMEKRTTSMFPIENEATNGLKNVRGAVAMARGGDPHSATTEFFIDLVDNAKLDFKDSTATGWGYAVFGKVVQGMDVVDRIAKVPTKPTGRYEALPIKPVIIDSAREVGGPS